MSASPQISHHAGLAPAQDVGTKLAAGLGLAFFILCGIPTLVPLPSDVSGGQALMLLAIPVWFFAALNRSTRVLDPFSRSIATTLSLCAVALILLSMLSAFHAAIPFRVARPIVSLLTGPALFMLIVGTLTRARIYGYVTAMCLTVAAAGIVSIIATAEPALRAFIFGDSDRAAGFFKNPNQFGIVLSAILPTTLALAFGAEKRRAMWFVAVILMLVALILSGSKANLLLALVLLPTCLLIFVCVRYSGPARAAMIFVTVGGSALAGALLLLGLSILNPRALRLLNEAVVEGEATHSLVSRGAVWAESFDLFLNNPLLGIGAGQPIGVLSHSHNLLLDYARTLGLPGLMFVTILVLTVLISSAALVLFALRSKCHPVKDRFLCVGLAMGPVSYLASNMSSDSLGPTTSPYLFATLALGLGIRSLLSAQTAGRIF